MAAIVSAQVLGVGAGVDATDALDAPTARGGPRRRAYTPDTTSPAGGECRVAAVAVHVLAKQRDLGDAVGGEAATSATICSNRRLISGPRTAGTMQNAQLLSQPIWIVTHADMRPLTLGRATLGNAGVIVEDRRRGSR